MSLAEAAWHVAQQVLAPAAEDTDRAQVVPQANLDALAQAGLFGLACASGGDPPASTATVREIQRALAGACGATYFVWAQHHSPVRLLSGTENSALRERWLAPLCRGDSLAGIAFAYLRRPGPPALSAQRDGRGWRVSGTAPFVTSWGLADVFVIAATVTVGDTVGDRIVWFCIPGEETDAVRPSAPMELSVLQATCTVVLQLEGLYVPDADVVLLETAAEWHRRDRLRTAQPSSAAFGVAERCCRLLAEVAADKEGSAGGERGAGGHASAEASAADESGAPSGSSGRERDEAPITEAARSLTEELQAAMAHAYGLADTLAARTSDLPVDASAPDDPDGPGEGGDPDLTAHLAAMVEARSWGLDIAQRASLALVTAVGGRAMGSAHPAQRLAREAAFYAIQAQTGAIRSASLRRLTRAS
jgi:alkylation response protein AidB-like acyl-CoA dehydrogenase